VIVVRPEERGKAKRPAAPAVPRRPALPGAGRAVSRGEATMQLTVNDLKARLARLEQFARGWNCTAGRGPAAAPGARAIPRRRAARAGLARRGRTRRLAGQFS